MHTQTHTHTHKYTHKCVYWANWPWYIESPLGLLMSYSRASSECWLLESLWGRAPSLLPAIWVSSSLLTHVTHLTNSSSLSPNKAQIQWSWADTDLLLLLLLLFGWFKADTDLAMLLCLCVSFSGISSCYGWLSITLYINELQTLTQPLQLLPIWVTMDLCYQSCLSGQPQSVLRGKNFYIGHCAKTFQANSWMPAVLIVVSLTAIIFFFLLLLLTLTLAGGHKASTKQNPLALFSHTFFS